MRAPATHPRALSVVAGLLYDPQDHNRLLLTRRPLHKVRGGLWEFPGGKVDAGEDLHTALTRELREELGIEVHRSQLRLRIQQAYPDLVVDLQLLHVMEWQGPIHALEISDWTWVSRAHALTGTLPVSAADQRLLQRLALPMHYRITPDVPSDDPQWGRCWEMLLNEPVADTLCLWRLPQWNPQQRRAALEALLHRRPEWRTHLLVGRDAELALATGAGLHLAAAQLEHPPPQWEQIEGWRCASVHTPAELARAQELGCDFATLSPVLPTATHPQAAPLGWERFADWVRPLTLPVYALGGVGPHTCMTALQHGAIGVAGIRQAW